MAGIDMEAGQSGTSPKQEKRPEQPIDRRGQFAAADNRTAPSTPGSNTRTLPVAGPLADQLNGAVDRRGQFRAADNRTAPSTPGSNTRGLPSAGPLADQLNGAVDRRGGEHHQAPDLDSYKYTLGLLSNEHSERSPQPQPKGDFAAFPENRQRYRARFDELSLQAVLRSSSATSEIQQALTNHGFETNVDGVRGDQTERGLKAFQKKNELRADGLPGPLTLKKLLGPERAESLIREAMLENAPSTQPTPNYEQRIPMIGKAPRPNGIDGQ
ncbi:MAG: peptidoglycan-binding protein [Deltaproteobacteria bacterium]|nr:peptidoglycan-binding protein [Deltaproteobacteria bacterium]